MEPISRKCSCGRWAKLVDEYQLIDTCYYCFNPKTDQYDLDMAKEERKPWYEKLINKIKNIFK